MIFFFLNLCISRCEGTNSPGGGAILVSDTRTMVWKGKPVTEDTRCNHNLSFKTLRAFKLSLSQWDEKEKRVTEDTRCNRNLSFKTFKLSLSERDEEDKPVTEDSRCNQNLSF